MTLPSSRLLRRILPTVAAVLTVGLAASACGSDTASSSRTTPSTATSASSPSSSAPATSDAGGSSSSSEAPSESASTAGTSAPATDTFPVTVKNIYGETTIDAQPERVATISWVNPDIALALGFVPVGGVVLVHPPDVLVHPDRKDAVLDKLGAPIGSANAPKQWDPTDGINFDAIAESEPDVILAAYSGLTKDEYDKLSKIAPVVGPVAANYTASWQDSTTAIGAALGKSAAAKTLIADVEKQIADAAAEHPEFKGVTFIAANLDPTKNNVAIYATGDTRPRFFTSLGMTQAPVVDKLAPKDQFYFEVAAEKANELDSDIIFSWVDPKVTLKSLQANKLFGQIPAVKSGASILVTDNALILGISAASPLSLQWALPQYLPLISQAVTTAKKS